MKVMSLVFQKRIRLSIIFAVITVSVLSLFGLFALNSSANEPQYSTDVFQEDYDSSWVSGVPDEINGMAVLSVETPDRVACLTAPVIALETDESGVDEFLASLDQETVNKAAGIAGVPSDVRISFSPAILDSYEIQKNIEEWNERKIISGCDFALVDQEIGNNGQPRGWAAFVNLDADSYTDDNAQSVIVESPSQIGGSQNEWSAVTNNVKTDGYYLTNFIQTGMTFDSSTGGEIVYAIHGGNGQPFWAVNYYASHSFRFVNTYTSGVWWMCAEKLSLPTEYQCITSPNTDGDQVVVVGNGRDTSVYIENKNTNSNWYSGFPSSIEVRDAKIYRNGLPYYWTSEDRLSDHNCGSGYPVSGALTNSLKNYGTASFDLDGVALNCP